MQPRHELPFYLSPQMGAAAAAALSQSQHQLTAELLRCNQLAAMNPEDSLVSANANSAATQRDIADRKRSYPSDLTSADLVARFIQHQQQQHQQHQQHHHHGHLLAGQQFLRHQQQAQAPPQLATTQLAHCSPMAPLHPPAGLLGTELGAPPPPVGAGGCSLCCLSAGAHAAAAASHHAAYLSPYYYQLAALDFRLAGAFAPLEQQALATAAAFYHHHQQHHHQHTQQQHQQQQHHHHQHHQHIPLAGGNSSGPSSRRPVATDLNRTPPDSDSQGPSKSYAHAHSQLYSQVAASQQAASAPAQTRNSKPISPGNETALAVGLPSATGGVCEVPPVLELSDGESPRPPPVQSAGILRSGGARGGFPPDEHVPPCCDDHCPMCVSSLRRAVAAGNPAASRHRSRSPASKRMAPLCRLATDAAADHAPGDRTGGHVRGSSGRRAHQPPLGGSQQQQQHSATSAPAPPSATSSLLSERLTSCSSTWRERAAAASSQTTAAGGGGGQSRTSHSHSHRQSQPPPVAGAPQRQSIGTTPIKCFACNQRLEDRHFVQCPSVDKHKFCFICSRGAIERQRKDHRRHQKSDGAENIFCPSGDKCFFAAETKPWTFMASEIETIFRESPRPSRTTPLGGATERSSAVAVAAAAASDPADGQGDKSAASKHATAGKQPTD